MIGNYKRLLKNKDAKTLLENFISLSALQLIGMVLPLITLPYILRVIGFEKYGIIVFAGSLIAYFRSLTDFSFFLTATRDVAVFKSSPRKLNTIYSKVLIIKGIFFLISLIAIISIVLLYPPFRKNGLIYFLTVPMLLGYAIFPDWFFQGMEKMKYITFLNLGIKIFFTLCIFIFIRTKSDFWIYPLLNSAGFLFAGIVAQIILVRQFGLRLVAVKRRYLLQTIRENTPIFLSRFLPTLYNNTSTFLLGMLSSYALVGVFQAIKSIIDLCITLINILSRVFFPFLNRRKGAFIRYRKMMLVVGSTLTIFSVALHPLIFWYLNIKDKDALSILICLACGLVGLTLYDIYGTNYFIVHRKDKVVMNNSLRASVIGFALAFPLIYYYGALGAAINLSLARWMMGGGLSIKYLIYKKSELHN